MSLFERHEWRTLQENVEYRDSFLPKWRGRHRVCSSCGRHQTYHGPNTTWANDGYEGTWDDDGRAVPEILLGKWAELYDTTKWRVV